MAKKKIRNPIEDLLGCNGKCEDCDELDMKECLRDIKFTVKMIERKLDQFCVEIQDLIFNIPQIFQSFLSPKKRSEIPPPIIKELDEKEGSYI